MGLCYQTFAMPGRSKTTTMATGMTGINLNPKGRPDARPQPAKVAFTVEQWGSVLGRILDEYGRDPRCGQDMSIDPDRIETIIQEEVDRG